MNGREEGREGREGGREREGEREGEREVVIWTHFQMVEGKQNTKLGVSPWVGNVLLDREGEGERRMERAEGGREGESEGRE